MPLVSGWGDLAGMDNPQNLFHQLSEKMKPCRFPRSSVCCASHMGCVTLCLCSEPDVCDSALCLLSHQAFSSLRKQPVKPSECLSMGLPCCCHVVAQGMVIKTARCPIFCYLLKPRVAQCRMGMRTQRGGTCCQPCICQHSDPFYTKQSGPAVANMVSTPCFCLDQVSAGLNEPRELCPQNCRFGFPALQFCGRFNS